MKTNEYTLFKNSNSVNPRFKEVEKQQQQQIITTSQWNRLRDLCSSVNHQANQYTDNPNLKYCSVSHSGVIIAVKIQTGTARMCKGYEQAHQYLAGLFDALNTLDKVILS